MKDDAKTGIDESLKHSTEIEFTNPVKHLSKKTLKDFEPESMIYEESEFQWEKKLKNRITNGSISPLVVMDRKGYL